MAIVYYPAIIERAGSTYSVFFPDIPGCGSAGRTVQEAARNAEEALSGHLVVADERAEPIAPPSDIDAIDRDPEVDEVTRLLVRADRPGRAIRLNITMDEGLVAAIDRIAANRSGFLANAARAALAARAIG